MKRRFVTEKIKNKMRELEQQGKLRAEIAELLNLDPATVTRHLGSVRSYRGMRASGACAQRKRIAQQ